MAVSEDGPTTAEPLVRVQLLGALVISVGAKTAGPWPRTSAKRLLALVLLSPKRRISKEVASDTLFRDLPPAAATNAMYNALSAARGGAVRLGRPSGRGAKDRPHAYLHSPATRRSKSTWTCTRAPSVPRSRLKPGDDRDAALVDVLSEERVLLEDEAYSDWALGAHGKASNWPARRPVWPWPGTALLALASPARRHVIEAWETFAAHDPASEEAASP